jgi:hypothetical protein
MEDMCQSVVDVSLSGAQPDNFIAVTRFDFISQFYSLLSDKELNVANNLIVNQHGMVHIYLVHATRWPHGGMPFRIVAQCCMGPHENASAM